MSKTKKIKLRNEKSENVNVVPQEFKETHKFVQTETNNKLCHHRNLPSLVSVNKIYKKHFDNVLTSYDALTLLRTAKDEDFSKDPPVKPQSGEIYLFQYPISPDDHHEDWCCDGISWRCTGSKTFKAKKDVVKKRYHRLANGNGSFNKKAFLFARQKSFLVVVHYRGDTSAIQHKPHGNRKQFLERTHVRTMPSTLKLIGKSSEQPKQIYKSLVAKPCPSAVMTVKHPKSTKQVADKKRYEGEKRSVSHDDLYGAYEIAHTLTDFVLDFQIFPNFYIIFGIPQLMQQAKKLYRSEGFYFCYDTTFNCGDFFVSTLLYRQIEFIEKPIIPLLIMVHNSKRQVVHEVFFSTVRKYFQFSTATLITDREASIENAIAKICPIWKHFYCWNHLLNDVKFWLHRHNAKSDDLLVYRNHICSLLNTFSAIGRSATS